MVRQERFCLEYVKNGRNGTQAAKEAGYAPRSAYSTAGKLLEKPEIALRISELEAEISRQVEVAISEPAIREAVTLRTRTLQELQLLGFSDITHYRVAEDGTLGLVEGAPEGAARAVESVKVTRRETPRRDAEPLVEVKTEIKLWSKPSALDRLAEHTRLIGPNAATDSEGGEDAPRVPQQVILIAGREIYL